jgi:RimJ/RimL family protein N-acetyltransferase
MNPLGQPIGEALPGWSPPPRPPRTALVGRYCVVRPLDPADARSLWEAFALDVDGGNWTYLTHGPYSTFEEFQVWLEGAASGHDPLFFTIADPAREPIGLAAYLRITPVAGTIEVGHIHISPRLQRTAAATEAMYLMMSHAFALGYRRYEWKCDSLNAPSRAAAERLGFSFEGIFRQALVYKGRNRDTAWYAILDREWPALRAAFERWLSPDNFADDGRQRERLSDLVSSVRMARNRA